jgi:hypothetical protein
VIKATGFEHESAGHEQYSRVGVRVLSLVVTGLMQGAIASSVPTGPRVEKAARDYQHEVRTELHISSERPTGRFVGFIGTLAALFFPVFVFGAIVPFLLLGLVVVVARASVVRRGARLALRRHACDRLGS